ncbi:MAG TPA: hypothetical protein VK082_00285 [Paenalcaligenes sp.]|nr:hypothetical protein [Paenalcaligenes sp.]
MSNPSQKHVERQVRKEILRMRAAAQRQQLCQLGCEFVDQANPQHLLGRFLGVGSRSMRTFKWGRTLWSLHRRYELLLSSAWLLLRGARGRSLRWPTLGLVALRLLRFSLERDDGSNDSAQPRSKHQTSASHADFQQSKANQKLSVPAAESLPTDAPIESIRSDSTQAELAALQSRLEAAEALASDHKPSSS